MTTQMLREIGDQPAALERTLDRLLPLQPELAHLLRDRRHVLFAARGTSDNAAVYGRYLVEVQTGRGAALAAPSLATHYAVQRDLSDTAVISLSQSGATEEIVAVQAWAREAGGMTVAITNDPASPLSQGAHIALVTDAGPELAVPATKTYTAQLLAVAVLADALGPAERSFRDELARVPSVVAELVATRHGVDDAVALLARAPQLLVTGRGVVYGTALELALKLEETCLEPVRGLSYADLRHGPIAVVDATTTVVLVAASDGPMVQPMVELAEDLTARGASVVAIGGDRRLATAATRHLDGPALPEVLAPLGLIVPGQLLVERLARARGLNPDAPRGLSKVTQTDRG
jgi:glutamine---fructose-6-phosphate transaminase (isomerizing)